MERLLPSHACGILLNINSKTTKQLVKTVPNRTVKSDKYESQYYGGWCKSVVNVL